MCQNFHLKCFAHARLTVMPSIRQIPANKAVLPSLRDSRCGRPRVARRRAFKLFPFFGKVLRARRGVLCAATAIGSYFWTAVMVYAALDGMMARVSWHNVIGHHAVQDLPQGLYQNKKIDVICRKESTGGRQGPVLCSAASLMTDTRGRSGKRKP